MRSLRAPAFRLAFCWVLFGALFEALFGALPAAAETGAAAPKHGDETTDTADLIPRYLLQDVYGRVVTHESFPDRFQLITFGFTSCPDVCPTTLLSIKSVLDALGDKAARLQPLFITVDPERDSAALLREYTAAFDPRIAGLTGSAELIRRAAESFRVRYEQVREPGAAPGIYTMNHSAGMYLLDPSGRFLVKFASTAPPEEIAARIRSMMDADHWRPPSRHGSAPLR